MINYQQAKSILKKAKIKIHNEKVLIKHNDKLSKLKDKRNVETVLIPDKSQSRYTICLSVSVGCYLSCEFCATAQISKKLVRNLTPGEIISQIILSKDYIDDWSTQKKITNQVLMGEGSPFLNLDNVKIAIDNSKNKDGLEYGRTRITVSTVGVGIKKDEMNAIRAVMAVLFTKEASLELFNNVAPQYKGEKTSGFTRTTAIKQRDGDNAKIVLIELV